MTPYVSINGIRATKAVLRSPYTGVWYVDLDLDDEADLHGRALVRIGPLELRGTILPAFSGGFELASRYRIVGGAGGWSRRVDPAHFHNDANVKRSTVLLAIARAVGEQVETLADVDARMAPDFVLRAGPASRIVRQVLGSIPWWVGYDGITRVGPRQEREVTAPYDLLDYDSREKIATIGVEDPGAIVVGSVLTGRLQAPLVVRELELEVKKGSLRVTVWGKDGGGAATDDRNLRAFRALVREAFPEYAFLGRYRYRVVRQVVNRVDLQALRKRDGMPDLLPVPVHPGMAGLSAKLTPGALVLVEFIEGDPRYPIITHFASKDEEGFLPVELALDATGKVRIGETASVIELGSGVGTVIRSGDTVALGSTTGVISLVQGTAEMPPMPSRVRA